VSDQEAQQYLDDMVSERGYVLEYHKRLIGADYEFARAVNDIVDAAYLKERRLDRRTKELCFIVSLVAMRATKAHIQSHIKVALEEGCSPEEILEAIEISMPEAGVVAFQEGFNAWAARRPSSRPWTSQATATTTRRRTDRGCHRRSS
jgi:4-carboxymuconolactone decarboxylase